MTEGDNIEMQKDMLVYGFSVVIYTQDHLGEVVAKRIDPVNVMIEAEDDE
jgi:hypothetical protein